MRERFRSVWWTRQVALLAAITTIVAFRSRELFLAPTLSVEDGARVFAHFYDHRELSQILRFKGGLIDVNYSCRRTPTILAGRFLVVSSARRPRRSRVHSG